MKDKSQGKGGRFLWFFGGILFSVLIAGAVANFVPILDCPFCGEDEATLPQVGEVSDSSSCSSCINSGKLTIVDYCTELPVELNLPKVEVK